MAVDQYVENVDVKELAEKAKEEANVAFKGIYTRLFSCLISYE